MKNRTTSLLKLLFIWLPTTVSASPYDYCSQILAKGVHDIHESTHNIQDENLLVAWACAADSGSTNNQITLDLIIGSLPERGSFSNVEEWLKSNCTREQRRHGTGDYSHNLVQLVNSNIVDAWKSCVGGQNKGLICFAEDTGTSMTFTIAWNPGPGIPRTMDMELSIRNLNSNLSLPSKLIPGEDALDLTLVDPNEEAKVVVRATDNVSFRTSCSYLMIPKQSIASRPPVTVPGDGGNTPPTPAPPKTVKGPYPETFLREYEIGNLYIQVHRASSGLDNRPQASVKLPDGFRLLSGGAQVTWASPGNLLTSSFPLNDTEWAATATDYRGSSKGIISVYAIGARMSDGTKIPNSVYQLVTKKSEKKKQPTDFASVFDSYTLLGGGARVWNSSNPKYQSFLVGSFPLGKSWIGGAKDHVHSNLSEVSSYAIGISTEFLNKNAKVQSTVTEVTSEYLLRVPQGNCAVGQGEVLIGGGARANWQDEGLLLTSSYPNSYASWSSMAKEHEVHDSGTISTWCIGLKGI